MRRWHFIKQNFSAKKCETSYLELNFSAYNSLNSNNSALFTQNITRNVTLVG